MSISLKVLLFSLTDVRRVDTNFISAVLQMCHLFVTRLLLGKFYAFVLSLSFSTMLPLAIYFDKCSFPLY